MAKRNPPEQPTLLQAEPQLVSELRSRGFSVTDRASIHLPPATVWNLPKDGPIETPQNDLGLIDIPELIKTVRGTVKPSYVWPRYPMSWHHFYWPLSNYSRTESWERNGLTFDEAGFRKLPLNIGRLSRVFENWLHIVTTPPEVPSHEVMQAQMESWQVAENLFESRRNVLIWARRAKRRKETVETSPYLSAVLGNPFEPEFFDYVLGRHIRGVQMHTEALERVPPEFRLVEPDAPSPQLTTDLGRLVAGRQVIHVELRRQERLAA